MASCRGHGARLVGTYVRKSPWRLTPAAKMKVHPAMLMKTQRKLQGARARLVGEGALRIPGVSHLIPASAKTPATEDPQNLLKVQGQLWGKTVKSAHKPENCRNDPARPVTMSMKSRLQIGAKTPATEDPQKLLKVQGEIWGRP